MKEQWKYIPGWNRFQVSNLGNIRIAETGEMVTPNFRNRAPQPYVRLSNGNARTEIGIANLVLTSFVGRPAGTSKPRPLYRDGNPSNCGLDNLYWGGTGKNVPLHKRASHVKQAFLNSCRLSPPCASCLGTSNQIRDAMIANDYEEVDRIKALPRSCAN